MPKKVLDGFADIDAGQSALGAMKILEHEQLDVLQDPKVFGNEKIRQIMEMNQTASQYWLGRALGAQPTSVSFTAGCAGEPSVTFQGKNPANPEERWPYAQDVVKTFERLKDTDSLQQSLRAIANFGQ